MTDETKKAAALVDVVEMPADRVQAYYQVVHATLNGALIHIANTVGDGSTLQAGVALIHEMARQLKIISPTAGAAYLHQVAEGLAVSNEAESIAHNAKLMGIYQELAEIAAQREILRGPPAGQS